MLIKSALAGETALPETGTTAAPVAPASVDQTIAEVGVAAAPGAGVTPPDQTDVLIWNVGFVVVLVAMFYFLLIRPQRQRYKEHSQMLESMHKGEKIVLQSGMIATIHDISADGQEMTVDLHEGVRARILRSAIAGRYSEFVKDRPATDAKKA